MAESNYSLSKIHLPENKPVVRLLQKLALFTAGISILAGVAVVFLNHSLILAVLASVLIAGSIFSESKLNLFLTGTNFPKIQKTFLTLFALLCSCISLILGIFTLITGELGTGTSILLMGAALILARAKIVKRFYLIDLIILVALIIPGITFLDNVYALWPPGASVLRFMPFGLSPVFILLCVSILTIWPERGFMAVFTSDSISSKYSLRLLLINLLLCLLFGIALIIGMEKKLYPPFEALAIFTMLFITASAVLAWVNLRLLYRSELERFLMKEELRVHNITINLNNEELINKMVELEGTKKEYAEKLNYQKQVMDIAEELP